MTFEEYHKINRKYGCKIIPFDDRAYKYEGQTAKQVIKDLTVFTELN